MSNRYVCCPKCADKLRLHPEDAANGHHLRKVNIDCAHRPRNHRIEVYSGDMQKPESVIEVPDVICDLCNELLTGKPAVAVTLYKGMPPESWELDFMAPGSRPSN